MPLDFSDLIPTKPQASGISFDDLIPKKAASPEIPSDPELTNQPAGVPGVPQSLLARLSGTDRPAADTPAAPDTVDTTDTIHPGLRNALAPAANTTYGSILPLAKDDTTGDVRLALPSSLRSLATGALDLVEGPTTGTVTPEATNLLANAAISGGLTPSLARGTGAAISDTAELGAPAADLYRQPITAREVQARDGVPIMEAWNRAHAENTAAARPADSIAAIGNATDIDGAIAAAGKAAEAPAATTPMDDLVTKPVEETAPVLEPQSVGAAASRDLTQPDLLTEITPAQKATYLQKMVNQSAEDRLTPAGRDDAVYFPGVERPEAMKDFAPAAEGEASTALSHKTLYNTDSNYHDQYDAQVKKNNAVMLDGTTVDGIKTPGLHDLFGDANTRDAAMDEAKALMPGPVGLFNDEKPVDAQPIADKINEILASPAGKRDAVSSQLNKLLPKLYDVDGNLETLPSQLKGIRDDITDKLYDKTPTVEGNAARTARNQLRDVLSVVDDKIGEGLPGTKYQDYLVNLSAALGQVSKLDYLQRFLTGSKKLTDLSGNLLFSKVQRMLEDIQAHHADQTGGAKELSMPEINQIEAVRNELAAKDLLDKRAGVRGSPTAQLQNASGILGSGPLGTGIKGAAEMAAHAGLAATTGGIGNAALGAYRFIVSPAMKAAKVEQEAAKLAAMKQRLLDTTPRSIE